MTENATPPEHDTDSWRHAIAEIAADRTSGAMQLALTAAKFFADLPPEHYQPAAVELTRAQPCMAPLFRVANEALLALEDDQNYREEPCEPTPRGDDWNRFEGTLGIRVGAVVTMSWSSTVFAWLSAAREAHPLQIFVGESRPLCEGRHTAGMLAEKGHRVTFVTDALLPSLVASADIVLLGADAVTRDGVVNKVGSQGLAAAAHDAGKPYVVATSSLKLLPPMLEELGFLIRDDPPDDVWETAPEGVNVRNPLFECVPHRLLSGLLLDENYVTPDALLDLLPEIPVSSLW